ncbi:hypothetical protein PILCRDRAFT_13132 [Piloderma croceum F 1598]|uniref:Uncharacterized protein n=1 Tax=Piloderma croceum (strain F 1598) TaxID=765440 RepID=A0A0C3F7R8_PILCF|nr:hypothetical protein PILCRDRAFT_13132 [Piloderma croceum F 1598]
MVNVFNKRPKTRLTTYKGSPVNANTFFHVFATFVSLLAFTAPTDENGALELVQPLDSTNALGYMTPFLPVYVRKLVPMAQAFALMADVADLAGRVAFCINAATQGDSNTDTSTS